MQPPHYHIVARKCTSSNQFHTKNKTVQMSRITSIFIWGQLAHLGIIITIKIVNFNKKNLFPMSNVRCPTEIRWLIFWLFIYNLIISSFFRFRHELFRFETCSHVSRLTATFLYNKHECSRIRNDPVCIRLLSLVCYNL